MKIMGNVVGLTAPRPDWAQNDPLQPGYILNKPAGLPAVLEGFDAVAAQAADALPGSGGTLRGPLFMGGNALTGLNTPESGSDAATKDYVDAMAGSRRLYLEVVLRESGWTQSGGVYTQTVENAQILDTDRPHYGVLYSGTREQMLQQQEAFDLVDDLQTQAGKLVFTCFRGKPQAALQLQLEISRSAAGTGGSGVSAVDLEQAVSMALAQARDSGEFQGEAGKDGVGIRSIAIKEVY